MKLSPTPSCPPPFESAVKQLGRYEFDRFVHHRCRSFTIVGVVFSFSIVSGIHSVMGSDHLIFILVCLRNIVWDCRAIDQKLLTGETD